MPLNVPPYRLLPELRFVLPDRHADHRGWFSETNNRAAICAAGIPVDFLPDEQSFFGAEATLRDPRGAVFVVVVDIRPNSPRFGHHTCLVLSAAGGEQLYVPEGFAHGFCSLEADCELLYKVSAPYAPQADSEIVFNDPSLAIAWPFSEHPMTLSKRDRALLRLPHVPAHFLSFDLEPPR